jgi:OOP family OmpA-OmpF porin
MKIELVIFTLIFITFTGCTTIKKSELSSSEPQEVIQNIQQEKESLINRNIDLLGKNNFLAGDIKLNKAKKDYGKNVEREKVLTTLAESKAYFKKAVEDAKSRTIVPINILTARYNAIKSKVYMNNKLQNKLYLIDDLLINKTDTFRINLSTNDLSRFQNKYQELEVESIQNMKLGNLQKLINNASNNNAKKLAPLTFMRAQNKINYSKNLIRKNPMTPSYYNESVKEANKAVKLLTDVMVKLTNNNKGSTEKTALQLVYQERKLGELSDEVSNLQSSLSQSQQSNKSLVDYQLAMDKVRDSFREDEASVYQQGDQLVIQLRKMNFESGSASIPSKSIPLLTKVKSLISNLNPEEIIIQGHTDSSGHASKNLVLSDKRAHAVKGILLSLGAKYRIETRGYGESRPIANNQTKIGRIQNRRVDIIVKNPQ